MDEIKSIVYVYYENIDAILTNEKDLNKLNDMVLIGDEIALMSSKRYIEKLTNGSIYRLCFNESIDYNEFVNEVKGMIE